MKQKNVVDFHLDDLVDRDWLGFCPDENNWCTVTEDFDAAAKHFKVSRDLLEAVHEALQYMANELINATKHDIQDLLDLMA